MDPDFVAPTTVEEIFKDILGRYKGLLQALTTDRSRLISKCDPDKENLCLYGLPNGKWKVTCPTNDLSPSYPEPVIGINFANNGMEEDFHDWLSLVAAYSDSWLFALAFYFVAHLTSPERKRLFNLMNDLPTLFEIVTSGPR